MKQYLTILCCVVFCINHVCAEDWKLSGGKGQRLDGGVLEVTGTGESGNSNRWVGPPMAVEPGGTYRFSMEASSPTGGGGSAPCGLMSFSRDFTGIEKRWKPFSFVFKAPANLKESSMRVGQWQSPHTLRFRNMKIEPAWIIPAGIRSTKNDRLFLRLGEGEFIHGDVYRFNGSFAGEGSNAHRVFLRADTGFNSDRFTVGGEREIVYRFVLNSLLIGDNPPKDHDWQHFVRFLTASVRVNVNYHVRGSCFVDVSPTANQWREIGSIDSVGTIAATIPESYFPATQLFIRIRSGKDASFQVNQLDFEAKIPDDSGFQGVGETIYADVLPQTEKASEGYSSRPLFFDGQRTLYVEHRNDSDKPAKPFVTNPPSRMSRDYYTFSKPFDIEKGEIPAYSICFETKPFSKAPEYQVPFSDKILKYSFRFDPYRDADFGYLLADAPGLWWTEPDWKISPVKTAPAKRRDNFRPIQLTAAKNDYESFQLIVNGNENGRKNVTLTVDGDLQGPDGATIPAGNVELRYAYYHFVHRPTDKVGSLGDWPDALPPFEKPMDVTAKRNLPLWATVYVPENTKAGEYAGKLKLRYTEDGKDVEQTVPFALNVWDFALPRRNTLQTAYGRGLGRSVFRYHNCKTEEDRRAVLELYHENFAKYRVSSYDPVPLDPIRVKWNKETKMAELDFSAFDREMARVIEKYHVTGFRIPIQGMGGGTYESRRVGKILNFEEGTPEYEVMFSDYVKKLEAHLKERGWLDMVYVYWFDEPAPKDYEFVAKGFAKLQKHAPGLARMITEEPNAAFIEAMEKEGVKIDIWCPVSYNYNDDDVKARQKLGEKFWWYVCTGPKEPYCTLFIDHPGIELRMWHWQTWQRNIVGTLVWESVYWSSDSAFPDNTFQNPYDDPMGYVAGGPKGSKRYWGNGDGRFVYPPLDAAVPGMNDGKPVIKAPVASIRWEMIREGVEDYEMLVMLRNLKASHPEAAERIDTLLTIPAGITASLTEFSVDPSPIYQRRRLVGDLIEALLKK